MKKAYAIFVTVIIVAISLMAGCRDNRKIADKLVTSPPINNGGHTVDESKKKALVESLSTQAEPYVVSIKRFFDGNNDMGSIGCNLIQHPGIDRFRNILTDLLRRDDVEAVFAQISELDPGEGSWPFSDTVLVVGEISPDELRKIVSPLEPDEIGAGEEYGAPHEFLKKYHSPVYAVWWD